jgi:uncharacterized membrane protein
MILKNMGSVIIKAVTYRIAIITSNYTMVNLLAGRVKIALGLTIVSNIDASIVHYSHERIWSATTGGNKRVNCIYTEPLYTESLRVNSIYVSC